MSENLFVGNIPFTTAEEEIGEVLAQFTEVHSVRLVKNTRTGESRGFGFAEVSDPENAIKNLDNKDIQGCHLTVKHAVKRGNW